MARRRTDYAVLVNFTGIDKTSEPFLPQLPEAPVVRSSPTSIGDDGSGKPDSLTGYIRYTWVPDPRVPSGQGIQLGMVRRTYQFQPSVVEICSVHPASLLTSPLHRKGAVHVVLIVHTLRTVGWSW